VHLVLKIFDILKKKKFQKKKEKTFFLCYVSRKKKGTNFTPHTFFLVNSSQTLFFFNKSGVEFLDERATCM
jgi:hypothetical protein